MATNQSIKNKHPKETEKRTCATTRSNHERATFLTICY